jgi:hypothetical protein
MLGSGLDGFDGRETKAAESDRELHGKA